MNKIINGDSLEELKKIRSKSIDMTLLDPPYYRVVDEYWDKNFTDINSYINWTEKYVDELSRISKHSGVVWLFGYAYQLSFLIPVFEKRGFKYKQHIVIDKGIKSVAGRSGSKLKMFPTATEYIIYFYKDSRSIIRNELQKHATKEKKTAREINKHLGKAINGGGTWSSIAGIKQNNLQYPTKNDWEKIKEIFPKFKWKYENYVYLFNLPQGLTDVWSDINFYIKGRIHPTQKPEMLLKRIIEASTKKGYLILDPFSGSGSTGVIANKMKRNFILIEKDKKIYNRMKKRF